MSLVELLAYTVILSIVTTALFQLIHFIQKMNDDLIKEQEIYSEFNIGLLKLDTFISEGLNIPIDIGGYCIENTNKTESFYFTNDGALCKKSTPCPEDRNGKDCSFITKAIFKTDNKFFEEDITNPRKIILDFNVPNSILKTTGIYSYIE
jgi:hypothetical protein